MIGPVTSSPRVSVSGAAPPPPRVSVVIPCYNAAPYVAEALASVAAQTLAPHEIIVVDDGSSDGSPARIRESGVATRFIETRRAGASGARNAGLAAASGEFVAFLDADDCWYPEHLARAVALLGGGSDVFYVGARDALKRSGELRHPSSVPYPAPTRGLTPRDFVRAWFHGAHLMTSSFVVDRARMDEVGRFDPALRRGEDFDLWLRVLDGRTWCFDPVPTIVYRLGTPGSLSQDRFNLAFEVLAAWHKNAARYPYPEARRPVRAQARMVLLEALAGRAPPDFWPRAEVAFAALPPAERALFRAAQRLPRPFAAARAVRKRVLDRTLAAQWEYLRREDRWRDVDPPGRVLHDIARTHHGRRGLALQPVLALNLEEEAVLARELAALPPGEVDAARLVQAPTLALLLGVFRGARGAHLAALGPGEEDVRPALALERRGGRRVAHARFVVSLAADGVIEASLGDAALALPRGALVFASTGQPLVLRAGTGSTPEPARAVTWEAPITRALVMLAFVHRRTPPPFLRRLHAAPLRASPAAAGRGALRAGLAWWRYLLRSDVVLDDE